MAAAKKKTGKRPLWACPKCGQTFIIANIWHSCVDVPLDAHFTGKPPALRKAFDKIVRLARCNGPVTLRSVKTRIALQANTRFIAVMVRKADLYCHAVLDHGRAAPPVRKVDKFGNSYVHIFTLAGPADVDAVEALIHESYAVDARRHGR